MITSRHGTHPVRSADGVGALDPELDFGSLNGESEDQTPRSVFSEEQLPGLSPALVDALAVVGDEPDANHTPGDWDDDPWEEVSLAEGAGAQMRAYGGGHQPIVSTAAPQNPGRRPGDPLADPPGHPVIAIQEEMKTQDGALHLQTSDLAPGAARIRRSIYRGARLLIEQDQDYESLISPDGKATTATLVPARVEALHAEARAILLRSGLGGIDWEPADL